MELPEEKECGNSRGEQEEIIRNFQRSWFLALEILMGITQFFGISMVKLHFVWNFPPVWIFSGIA